MTLTGKQEKFTFYLFQGMNQTEAYKKAGYTSVAMSTANSAASRLANSVKVKERLKEMQDKAVSSKIMSVTERKEMLTLIARFGGKLSIPAIAELNKMDGSYAPVKQDITTKGEAIKNTLNIVNLTALSDQELETLERIINKAATIIDSDSRGKGSSALGKLHSVHTSGLLESPASNLISSEVGGSGSGESQESHSDNAASPPQE